MTQGRLVIGTQRYSSWSLRGWLFVKLAGLSVDIEVIPLQGGGQTPAAFKSLSPNGCVPYLEHNSIQVWDSLSIAEYCAEIEPSLWPADRAARAQARSVSAEMHSGFKRARSSFPMNLGRSDKKLRQAPDEELLKDIARIDQIWTKCRTEYGQSGLYLFGTQFGIADAMFAPVVTRFLSYGVSELSDSSKAYMTAVRQHPLMQQWYEEAAREPENWLLDRYELID